MTAPPPTTTSRKRSFSSSCNLLPADAPARRRQRPRRPRHWNRGCGHSPQKASQLHGPPQQRKQECEQKSKGSQAADASFCSGGSPPVSPQPSIMTASTASTSSSSSSSSSNNSKTSSFDYRDNNTSIDDDKDTNPPPPSNTATSTSELPQVEIDQNSGETVPSLDIHQNPVHARRYLQRKKMIAYGKNTAGYDAYCCQVPKQQRRKRFPDHPSTPNAMADIPTRRFQGLVRAWRQALHKYDPPDLLSAPAPTKDCEATDGIACDLAQLLSGDSNTTQKKGEEEPCVKRRQMEEAMQQGLQVQFTSDHDCGKDKVVEVDMAEVQDYAGEEKKMDLSEKRMRERRQEEELSALFCSTHEGVSVGSGRELVREEQLHEVDSDDDLL